MDCVASSSSLPALVGGRSVGRSVRWVAPRDVIRLVLVLVVGGSCPVSRCRCKPCKINALIACYLPPRSAPRATTASSAILLNCNFPRNENVDYKSVVDGRPRPRCRSSLDRTLQLSDVQLVPSPGEFLLLNITSRLILATGPMVWKHGVTQKTGST